MIEFVVVEVESARTSTENGDVIVWLITTARRDVALRFSEKTLLSLREKISDALKETKNSANSVAPIELSSGKAPPEKDKE